MKAGDVLIVDDSPPWVDRLREMVDSADMRVIGSASSAAEAIRALQTLRPPILILDMYLDGGSGMEVLEALPSLGIATKVLVLTGSPSEQLRKACWNLGVRFFVDKASEFEIFQDVLNRLRSETSNELPQTANVYS